MARYLLRRLLHSALLILVTLAVTFAVLHLAPGDVLSRYTAEGVDPATLARVRRQLGLDDALPEQFVRWLWSFLRGNFGVSLVHHRPVAEILRETIPRTLLLTASAFLVQVALGVLAGVWAAARGGRATDRAVSAAALVLYAVPSFYLAYLLIMAFALGLGWLPTSGVTTPGADLVGLAAVGDRLRHLVLPVAVLGVASAAIVARFTRGSVLDALREDFVRTARAKGLGEGRVVWLHALRAALGPVLIVLGLSAPVLLGGAVVVEKVFAWPGMGALMVDAIFGRDVPVVLAVNFVGAAMVVVCNLLADIGVAAADPRTELASAADAPRRARPGAAREERQ